MAAKFSAQDIASYAAVVVACIALYVGWDQSRINRSQQHADVFPVVQVASQYITQKTDDGGSWRVLTLTASNLGVGPAFIEGGKWTISGTTISHPSEIRNVFPEGLSAISEYQGPYGQGLLGAGKQEVIWRATLPNTPEVQPLLREFLSDFWAMDLEMCYCSLYERCWKTTYNAESARPDRVESCAS